WGRQSAAALPMPVNGPALKLSCKQLRLPHSQCQTQTPLIKCNLCSAQRDYCTYCTRPQRSDPNALDGGAPSRAPFALNRGQSDQCEHRDTRENEETRPIIAAQLL